MDQGPGSNPGPMLLPPHTPLALGISAYLQRGGIDSGGIDTRSSPDLGLCGPGCATLREHCATLSDPGLPTSDCVPDSWLSDLTPALWSGKLGGTPSYGLGPRTSQRHRDRAQPPSEWTQAKRDGSKTIATQPIAPG